MALTPNPRLAGLASITIDGTSYMLAGQPKWRPSRVTRESLSGSDGVHGFKEKPIPGRISANLRDSSAISVGDFNAMVGVSVVMSLANGKTIVGDGMWSVETQEVDSDEATFDLIFEGNDVSEQ